MKRLLICGDREWTNTVAIIREMVKLPKDTIIIQGCASGADTIAMKVAQVLGLELLSAEDNHSKKTPGFPAKWNVYGRRAGPVRNQQMLDEGKPNEVWAFHTNINKSKGTLHMIKIAGKKGITVRLFTK